MDQTILQIEENMEQFRLKKLDANGDFYEDDEDYTFIQDVDENEEHRLVLSDVI